MHGFDPWDGCRRLSSESLREETVPRVEVPDLPARPVPGTEIDRFRILRPLYSGRNSSVYEAFEKGRGRSVALKVLAPELAVHGGLVERLRLEAELSQRVRHASILPASAWGRTRDYAYLVMRLERGRNLQHLAGESSGAREEYLVELAARFSSIADAVARLHTEGIVHRDIQPSNVLINGEGLFLLSDFGSALDSRRRALDLQDWIGGTLRYMSPEQVLPNADPYDPAGDVYALGSTLYELLTGEAPFPVEPGERLARAKLTRKPAPPRRLNPHVPLGLDAIVRQAIEPNPALRYASAEEMARDLKRFVSRRRGSHRNRPS